MEANQGDLLPVWDTGHFLTDIYYCTYCMLEILKAGGLKNGGFKFDAKSRRSSADFEDIVHCFIADMDGMALGLRKTAEIILDGRVDNFAKERYAGWSTGIGAKVTDGETSLEELESDTFKKGDPDKIASGKQEYLLEHHQPNSF